MKYVIFTLSTLLWDLAGLSKIFLLSLSVRLENPWFPVYQHMPGVSLPFSWFKVPFLWPWPPLLFFCIHRNRNCRTKKYVGLHFGNQAVVIFCFISEAHCWQKSTLDWRLLRTAVTTCSPLPEAPAPHALHPGPEIWMALSPLPALTPTDLKA